jgi:hypothetical protein
METIIQQMRQISFCQANDYQEYNTIDTYDYIDGLWISKVSNVDGKLVFESNHFIKLLLTCNDIHQEDGLYAKPRKPHYIYSRILANYNKLIHTIYNITQINDKCVYLHNSFSSGNMGHDLFVMLNVLDKYKDNQTIMFILFNEIETNNTKIIKLLIEPSRCITIKQGLQYNFTRQIITPEQEICDARSFSPLIQTIREQIDLMMSTNMTDIELNKLMNLDVIIIKNKTQNKIVRSDDLFEATYLFEYLHKHNWYICNPESDDFYKMVYILMHAQTIVTGQNGISCCNQVFYNLEATIIGFIVNYENNNMHFVPKEYIHPSYFQINDKLCNGYYYHRMRNVILSPLSITENNVAQFSTMILS